MGAVVGVYSGRGCGRLSEHFGLVGRRGRRVAHSLVVVRELPKALTFG